MEIATIVHKWILMVQEDAIIAPPNFKLAKNDANLKLLATFLLEFSS